MGSEKATRLAVLALLVNAFVWGVAWFPLRYLNSQGLHALWCTLIFTSLSWLWTMVYQGRPSAAFYKPSALWLLALSSGLTNVCFNWAISIGDVIRVVLLFYFMPAWANILAWIILKEKPTLRSILQLLLSLAGMLFVLKQPDSPWPLPSNLADWLGLLGGFFFALTNVLLRLLKDTPSATRMNAMFGGGCIASFFAVSIGMDTGIVPELPAFDWHWVLAVLAFALAALIGNLCLQYGTARLLARTTALIMLSEIIFASVSSIMAGVSVLNTQVIIGAACIMGAAAWSVLRS